MIRIAAPLLGGVLLGLLVPAVVAFAVITVCDIDCMDLRD